MSVKKEKKTKKLFQTLIGRYTEKNKKYKDKTSATNQQNVYKKSDKHFNGEIERGMCSFKLLNKPVHFYFTLWFILSF